MRSARWVVSLGRRLDPDLPGGEVSLFDGRFDPAQPLPWTPLPGLTILALDRRHAVSSWAADAPTGSQADPLLTALMGVPVTGRSVRTMLRLAELLEASSRPDLAARPAASDLP